MTKALTYIKVNHKLSIEGGNVMYYDERENNLNYSIVEEKNVDLTNNYLQNVNEFNYDVDNKIKKFNKDFKVDTINVNVNNPQTNLFV